MFGLAQPTILAFPAERAIFLREYATGTYSVVPYCISKLMVEIPMAVLQSTVIWVLTYFLMDLQAGLPWGIIELIGLTALFGLTAASTALVISAASPNVQAAIQATPLLFVPQLLFSGFFIRTSSIPQFLRWAQYLCSLKYALNLASIVEFEDVPEQYREAVDASIFKYNDVSRDSKWLYVGILFGIFCAFRLLACVTLTIKARNLS